MPRIKLTKSTIDALPIERKDVIYWDQSGPGFGVKVTPHGRKFFLVLYRTAGGASKLRKFTIGPYGKVTLHQARIAAQRVFTAKLEGRDPAGEKREARMREVTDRVADLLTTYFAQRLAGKRSGTEIARLLQRELGSVWGNKSIHDIRKRDVVELMTTVQQRGTPSAANKILKSIKAFFGWCVGRAILDHSPAEKVPLPSRETARDRVLNDAELAAIIWSARTVAGPYGGIVELLALTGQRREEAAKATWDELDLGKHTWIIPKERTKNAKAHVVHLSSAAVALLEAIPRGGAYVFSADGIRPFQSFFCREAHIGRPFQGHWVACSRSAANLCFRNGSTRRRATRGGQNT